MMSGPSHALAAFHPTLASWFTQTFGSPTPVQLEAWASIMDNQHTLIAAPTGSGKTLAALLPCLDKLVRDKINAVQDPGRTWTPGVRVLYVTPLKALNNDIQYHLVGFIEALEPSLRRRFRSIPSHRRVAGHTVGCAYRRYPFPRTCQNDAEAAGCAGHNTGIVVLAAYLGQRPRYTSHRRDCHRR